MPRVTGNGTIYQMEPDKPKSKCRKWKLQVSLGKNLATGKYDRAFRTVSGTYTDAKNAMRAFMAEIESGRYQLPASDVFEDFADAWLARRKQRVAYDTWNRDRYHIENAKLHIGKAKLHEVTSIILERMYQKLLDGESVSGRKLSGTYVSNLAATLHSMFRDAIRDDLITVNPCDAARSPKKDTKERKALRSDGIRDVISKLDPANATQFVIRLCIKTGMRRGEVVGLDIGDIDFTEKTIHVRHGTESTSRQKATKTPKGTRDIPMTPSAEKDIKMRLRALSEEMKDVGLLPDRSTPLVCNMLGERLRPDVATHWWRENRKDLGYDGWTIHEMRHSYLSELARRNVPPKVLQELAGHESIETTMDIYIHVGMEDKQEAVKVVDW